MIRRGKSDELSGTFIRNSGFLVQLVDKKKRLVASNLPFLFDGAEYVVE
jgi:predicted FMN-binding regulatory protein PaiB